MPYVSIEGYKLFYEMQGQGESSLIFIHGLCGDHSVWSKNIPAFIDDCKTAALDMFGHGDSEKNIDPEKAFQSMPGAIERLIEKEDLRNVVLIGHSIAGNILLSCMEQNIKNIRGYVFVDCAFNASQAVVESRNKFADSLLGEPDDRRGSAVRTWYQTMMDMDAPVSDNELIFSALEKTDGRWTMNFLKASNFVRAVPQTGLPVLIFESDWLTKDQPERAFSKVLPGAEKSHWPVSNHFFFVYEAEKFNKRLKEFLEKVFSKNPGK